MPLWTIARDARVGAQNARAGTSSQFFWGGADTRDRENDYAWTVRNAGGRTHPVARKKPNPFGFFDILGNVTEWSWSTPLYDRNVFRPTLEDIVDPKAERMWGATAWRIKPVGFAPPWAPAALGCSWYWGGPTLLVHSEKLPCGVVSHADCGLRVARSLPAPWGELSPWLFRREAHQTCFWRRRFCPAAACPGRRTVRRLRRTEALRRCSGPAGARRKVRV